MGTKVYDNALDLISFSRASGGTALRRVGYGPELVTNGTFDTDTTGWIAGSGVTLAAVDGDLRITRGASVNQSNYASIATVSGRTYQVSWEYKGRSAASTHYTDFRVGSTIGGLDYYRATDISAAEFSQGVRSGVFAATGTTTYISVLLRDGTSGDWIEVDNVSVKEVLFDRASDPLVLFNHPINIPRIEYAADGTLKGLLVEEARTNLVTYSIPTDAVYWTSSAISATENVSGQLAPDDTQTVTKLVESATTASRSLFVSFSVTGNHSCSVFVKSAGNGRLLRFQAGSSNDNYFDPDTGLWGTTGARSSNHQVENWGNGWYRVSFTYDGVSGVDFFALGLAAVDGTASYTGDGTSGIYIWGAQFEAGAFPTSYIPTAGATATRAVDIASIPVSAFGYNQTDTVGTFTAEFSEFGTNIARVLTAVAGNDRAVDINVLSNNQVDVYSNHTLGALYVLGSSVTGANKVAASMTKDNAAACLNGGAVKVDTTTTDPIIATSLELGRYLTGSYLNGHIKSIAYYPRRLSNAQLIEVTS